MSIDSRADERFSFDKADRIRRAMRVAEVGVGELATYLQVSRNTVGNWINGHAEPRPRDLKQIAMRTGFPYTWLENGEAPHDGGAPDDGGWAPWGSNPRPAD